MYKWPTSAHKNISRSVEGQSGMRYWGWGGWGGGEVGGGGERERWREPLERGKKRERGRERKEKRKKDVGGMECAVSFSWWKIP